MLIESVLEQEKCYFEELHSNACKHELQESGDNEDVSNGADGHKHTLDHTLETQTGKHSEKALFLS